MSFLKSGFRLGLLSAFCAVTFSCHSLFASVSDSGRFGAMELSFAPGVGYSSLSGVALGGALGLNLGLSEFVQASVRGRAGTFTRDPAVTWYVSLGALVNFSPEWEEAYFAGAGIGYTNSDFDVPAKNVATVYTEVGKRFLLSKSWKIAYSPYLRMDFSTDGSEGAVAQAQILNFSVLF